MWLEHKIGSVCHPIGSIGGTTFAFFAMLVESVCPVCGGGGGFIQAGSHNTGECHSAALAVLCGLVCTKWSRGQFDSLATPSFAGFIITNVLIVLQS